MPESKPAKENVIFELTGAQISSDLQQTLPATPGCCYRFQFRVKGAPDGGSLSAELSYLNGGGGSLATYAAAVNPGNLEANAWISYFFVTAPSPVTTTHVRIHFAVQGRTKSLELSDVLLAAADRSDA